MSTAPKTSSTETGNNKDDGSINFRPSPNFKHMKKYLKSKFEEDMNLSIEKEQQSLKDQNKVSSTVQPPLPPNSPPPDSPLATIKQEVVDDEYEQQVSEEAVEEAPQAQSTTQEPERKKVMCKDFVRKTCTRGAACIYAHEIDYSQLKGVYKFCRDFENGCCNRSICYFVHATTWEKEHFFRSAYLPPHALAHLKTPATPPTSEGQKEMTTPIFKVPPPRLPPSMAAVSAPAPVPPGGVLPSEVVPAPPPPTPHAPSLKREWRDLYDFGSPPRDLDAKEPLAKKCKRCELTELRLQHSKAQVAQAMRSSRELDEKLEHIIKKNNKLHGVLKVLLKPRRALEQVNNTFLSPSRTHAPALAEDAGKEALYAQMKVLLTKMLLAGDSSPEGAAAGS